MMTIKEFRLSQKLSQVELATALGISVSSERQYEYGKRDPSATVVARIKEIYGVDLNEAVTEAAPAAKPKRGRKKKDAAAEAAPAVEEKAEKAEEAAAKPKRGRKKKEAAAEAAPAVEEKTEKAEEAPAKPKRTRKKKEAAAEAAPVAETVAVEAVPAEPVPAVEEAAPAPAVEEAPAKPAKRGRKKKDAAPAAEEKVEKVEAPAKPKRTRKKKEESTPVDESLLQMQSDAEAAVHALFNEKGTVIIQSPMGGEITPEEILAKVGPVDKVYVRVDLNTAFWVRGEESGAVNLW